MALSFWGIFMYNKGKDYYDKRDVFYFMAMQEIGSVMQLSALGASLFRMELSLPSICRKAQSGQFLHIACGEENLLRRPISICDTNAESGRMTIVFEAKGAGTQWLSRCKAGDPIDVLGPLGNGFDIAALGAAPVLIGGGIGVPPMLMTAKACAQNSAAVRTIAGVRDRAHVILEAEFSMFQPIICTDDGSYGRHGFVTDALKELLPTASGIAACGPKPMLRAVAQLAKAAGLPCQVSMEERMGCGIGACLVCACTLKGEDGSTKYGHVCKDGPVFKAEEVLW